MNRVNNASKYLKGVVDINKKYYIGFGIKELSSLGKEHKGLNQLISGIKTTLLLTGKKGIFKENTTGKFVRKQPENKTSIWKHIHFYSKHFGKDIEYDRQFHIWEKEILHKYELELEAAQTPQGETVLHFPMFQMVDSEEHYMKAGAAMNMAIALGTYFMIYDIKFEPIVPVTKFEHKRMLPPGKYGTIEEKLEVIEKAISKNPSEERSIGNSYRFAMLKENEPNEVTMGLGGFDEYLRFEFSRYNLLILENLKSGNATYIFELSKFDMNKELNKKTALLDPSFLKRVVHENSELWSNLVGKYFK
jgi:hypothetical protein